MSQGEHCTVEDPTVEVTHGDVVHPCIRFIEEGFEGHQWWMVYTPYYGYDASLENPRLCYSDAKRDELPTQWSVYCQIAECPKKGYDSDPTLLFIDGNLYMFIRKNYTDTASAAGYSRVTTGYRVSQKKVIPIKEPLLTEPRRNIDKEVCPTFVADYTGFGGYTLDIRFCSRIMYFLPQRVSRWVYRQLDRLYDLCIYSRFHCRGVAIWHSSSIDKSFEYLETVRFRGRVCLYQPWHMDLFPAVTSEGKAALFAVVLSNSKQGDICLARSDDGKHFRLYKKPLITSFSYGMNGLYKPSAVVVDGKFMLFYTYLDSEDRINKMLVTADEWANVLQRVSC